MNKILEEHLNETLDTLCSLLNEELARQEEVLENCRAQSTAAREYDPEMLEAKTREMVALIENAVASEGARNAVVSDVVAYYDLPQAKQTLSALIEILPDPWRGQLDRFQKRMHVVLQTTRRTVRKNATLFKGSLRSLDRSLDILVEPTGGDTRAYTRSGDESGVARESAAVMDARG